MTSRIPFLLITALPLAGCGPTASDRALGDFTAKTDSLARKAHRMDSVANAEYNTLPTVGPDCAEFAARTDTLRGMCNTLADRIDQMKYDLLASKVDDPAAGERVFNTGDAGGDLFRGIKAFYVCAERYGADRSSAAEIHQYAATAFPFATMEAWREHSFTRQPRATVITLLSRTRADLAHTESLCIDPMILKCATKSTVPASGDIGGRKQEVHSTKEKKKKAVKESTEEDD